VKKWSDPVVWGPGRQDEGAARDARRRRAADAGRVAAQSRGGGPSRARRRGPASPPPWRPSPPVLCRPDCAARLVLARAIWGDAGAVGPAARHRHRPLHCGVPERDQGLQAADARAAVADLERGRGSPCVADVPRERGRRAGWGQAPAVCSGSLWPSVREDAFSAGHEPWPAEAGSLLGSKQIRAAAADSDSRQRMTLAEGRRCVASSALFCIPAAIVSILWHQDGGRIVAHGYM